METSMEWYVFLNINKTHDSLFKPDNMKVSSPSSQLINQSNEERQDPNLRLEDCHLRVDWQTLRRLPLSAAVLFNFKAVFTPVTEFRDEPVMLALRNIQETIE